jgi:hypothetical protein
MKPEDPRLHIIAPLVGISNRIKSDQLTFQGTFLHYSPIYSDIYNTDTSGSITCL